MFTYPAVTLSRLIQFVDLVRTRLTINLVGNHTTGYLRSVLSQLLIPVGQILICDLPLNIENLRERKEVYKGV